MSSSTLAIVVSHNNEELTHRCVGSLKHQARVVVWDNNSSDATVEILKRHHPEVTVHSHPENILWTPALNWAMDQYHVDEEFILFSNNDIQYGTNTLFHLKVPFQRGEVGITAPSGSRLGGMQDFGYHWPLPSNMDPERWRVSRPDVRANFVVGAAMMITKEVWETVGRFDESMPLGADDHDYCLRAKEKGYQIWVVSSAYVEHAGHASASTAPEVWEEWGKKSWEAFNKKWEGYFFNEEEAKKCHWEAKHTPGWEIGTGRLSPEERAKVWALRTK